MSQYKITCTCGEIEVGMKDSPKVRGYCHCSDCRDLLSVPYHAVNAWEKDKIEISKGGDLIREFKHPRLNMKKYSCSVCSDVLFNSNGMDWRVFSQLIIARSYGNHLPDELQSKSHFYYGSRIIDIDDELPKRE